MDRCVVAMVFWTILICHYEGKPRQKQIMKGDNDKTANNQKNIKNQTKWIVV